MSNEMILMLHPAAGVFAILAAVWVIAETLNASEGNVARIRTAAIVAAVLIWAAYLIGGYWYVLHYGADKAVIKAGPWPFAHTFVMETKEHVFLTLLLLASFLPIATFNDLVANKGARSLVMWSAAAVVVLGLAMEGAGAVISMGVKMGLLAG